MKRKARMICGILMAVLVMLLSGCGNISQADSKPQEAVQTDIPAETVSPAGIPGTAENKSIADIYEKTANEHIYALNTLNTEGYGVEKAYLQDGYALIVMQDYSEQGFKSESGTLYLMNSGKLVLFPLNNPGAAVSLEIERFSGTYKLLAGGNVLAVNWDGTYTLYNSRFEELYSSTCADSIFLGASDSGDIWFLNDESSFVLYRDGKQVHTVKAEGMRNGNYKGTRSGKAYFEMFNEYYGWTYSAIDLQDWSYTEVKPLYDYSDICEGLFSYRSEDKWYIAGLDDPLLVTAFTKPDSKESVWKMDDLYLIGESYKYDVAAEDFVPDFRIYDMRSGGLCDAKNSRELSEYGVTLCDYEQGIILFETHDKKQATKGLYLWDINGIAAEKPAQSYVILDFHIDQKRVDELIGEIYSKYGVSVYYDAEHLKEYSSGYNLTECADIDMLGYTLIKLNECMAEYPEGFFEEVKGESIGNVVFCLCDGHNRTDMDSIEDAAATVATIENTLRMSIDVHYWQGLRRIFLHENTHMMENRIEEELQKITAINTVEYWYREMNLPDCPPIQRYIWEQTDENMKGVYELDPENACYIDWYSKCTINEDHARIMENGIYSGSEHYYTAPYIDRKSRLLNAMIRAAFPCVQNSEDVFWEQRTGPVDLYSEFPALFVQK